MVKTIIFTKTERRIKSVLEEVAMLIESINGKQILENEVDYHCSIGTKS